MQDKDENNKITAFDTLFTNDHIRMCKILLPYLDQNMQRFFALYIKLSELTYTLNFIKNYPFFNLHFPDNTTSQADAGQHTMDIPQICTELLPYSNAAEKEKLSRLADTFRQIRNMQDMMEMLQMMKELFPEGGSDLSGILSGIGGGGGADGFSFDPSVLMEMFRMMNAGSAAPQDDVSDGE